MLRSSRDSPRALVANLLLDVFGCAARVRILCVRRLCDIAAQVLVRFDELAFASVPGVEDFGGGSAPEDARVDEAGEADAGDVAGGAVNAFEVPDGFCSVCVRMSVFSSLLSLS